MNTVSIDTVRLDSEGRILLPQAVREGLDLKPGDELIVEWEGDLVTVETLEAFILRRGQEGEAEYRNGLTIPLRQYMIENGIDPDAADDDLVIH